MLRPYVILQAAEARGNLCRDESGQGTLFYPNRFSEFVAKLTPVEAK